MPNFGVIWKDGIWNQNSPIDTIIFNESGKWQEALCPKCKKMCAFWDGGKKAKHIHIGCGGVLITSSIV